MTFLSDRTMEHLRGVADLPDLSETKYRLVGELGRGGMGTVYLALDTTLGREVAIKVLGALEPGAEKRMMEEARILARLEHPGIVPVHDAGILPDGRVFYAMRLVRGSRLDEYGERGVAPLLRVFERICEAVAFAHARGVVHRDLKPANVMVGAFGEVLVLDWGVARSVTVPGRGPTGVTGPEPLRPALSAGAEPGSEGGTVVGTPGYMAPEQSRGEPADQRSDVFSLGAILFFLLTRRDPPAIGEVTDTELALAGDVPPPLRSVCGKAMAPLPAHRYESAEALAAEVARHLEGERVAAHPEKLVERVARVARRHRVWILLVSAYLLMRMLLLLLRG